MRPWLTPIKVGLVLAIGIAAFAWYVVKSADSPITGGRGYTVHALFDNAMGLVKKSRVLIAGISVGEIKTIKLEGQKARVYLTLDPEYPIYANATIRKVQESILGTSLLEIYPGDPSQTQLHDGDEITKVLPTPGLNDLMGPAGDISKDVKAITGELRDMLASNETGKGSIRELVENLAKVSEILAKRLEIEDGTLHAIIDNTSELSSSLVAITRENREDIRVILEQIRDLTKTLRDVADKEGGRVGSSMDRVESILNKLDKSLDKLDSTLNHTSSITEKIDNGQGAVGTLINDEQVAQDIKDITSTASNYVKRLDNLRALVHLQTDFYINELAFKTAVTFKLQPRPDKYYLISLIDDPRGKTNTTRTIIKTTDSSKDAFVREEKSETTDAFKISVEYAQRWSFFTLRFGLIENTGGIGFDLEFFNDILKFRNDIYELSGERAYPRLKSQANVVLRNHIFLSGGVDDIASNQLRDYFFGAGIQFDDEDLKTLFGAGAGSASGLISK